MLPPHLSNEDAEIITNVIGWNNILEHYTSYPNGLKKVIPYLLASIIYHYESNFLNNNFYRGHPIWNSNIFTLPITLDGVSCINININIVKLLQGRILIIRNFCPMMKMKATGITQQNRRRS